MPHQCVRCSRIIPAGSKELLEGCSECGSHFFFYIKDEQFQEIMHQPIELPIEDKHQVEKEIREMAWIIEETTPVILDVESVRVTAAGKYEIDLVNLFNRKRPLIYKIEEGKYIIDLASTLQQNVKDLKEIKNPDERD